MYCNRKKIEVKHPNNYLFQTIPWKADLIIGFFRNERTEHVEVEIQWWRPSSGNREIPFESSHQSEWNTIKLFSSFTCLLVRCTIFKIRYSKLKIMPVTHHETIHSFLHARFYFACWVCLQSGCSKLIITMECSFQTSLWFRFAFTIIW